MENNRYKEVEVTPMLLSIANTILCNYSLVNNNNLVNGKMGVCLFLYEYSRLTGIKEYEDIADDFIDPILKTLHDGKNEDNINSIAGIGMGIIYLITHKYLEDTDDHDSLEAVDNFLIKAIEKASTPTETLIPPVLYFIYRFFNYRIGLERNSCLALSKHLMELFQSQEDRGKNRSILVQYIQKNVKLIYKSSHDSKSFLREIDPMPLDFGIEGCHELPTADYLWYAYLLGQTKSDGQIKESVLLNMCQNCFYDAERTVGALCSIGLEFMIHQYDNTLI